MRRQFKYHHVRVVGRDEASYDYEQMSGKPAEAKVECHHGHHGGYLFFLVLRFGRAARFCALALIRFAARRYARFLSVRVFGVQQRLGVRII